jgi:hypothetical protein
MSRLCLIIEDWAPLAIVAALVIFTLGLCGCTISPAPFFSPSIPTPAAFDAPAAVASVPAALKATAAPVTKQAQVAIAATKSAGALNTWGAIAIIIGAVCCAVPVIPNGLGFGLVAGGLICVLAGILLPVYAVWVGWGLVGAVGLFYLGRYKFEREEKLLLPTLQNNLTKNA